MSVIGIFDSYRESFNGAALVADRGEVLHKQGYGLANVEWNIANTPDTVFRIGSLTKQFTAMIVLRLVDKGMLKLNGYIIDYLPWYPAEIGSVVSIHNLLTHSSGIPSFTTMDFVQKHMRLSLPVQDFVQRFCCHDLEFQPGTAFKYSNSGYHILGAIIEQVTGTTYAQALSTFILQPLELKNTGYDYSEKIVPRRAAGYDKRDGRLFNTEFVDMSIPFAGGGMYSTVEDYYLWDQALASSTLLPQELENIMFTPVHGNYACGWSVARVARGEMDMYLGSIAAYQSKPDGIMVQRHEGGINGFHTLGIRIPERDGLVVIFSNMGAAPLNEIAAKILKELYGF